MELGPSAPTIMEPETAEPSSNTAVTALPSAVFSIDTSLLLYYAKIVSNYSRAPETRPRTCTSIPCVQNLRMRALLNLI